MNLSAARDSQPRAGRPETPPVVLALVGPTASGKTAISMQIAPALRAEIIVLDSMQVYRGMDIGTAKPSAAERRGVPHHMIDVVDPAQPYSAAAFQAAARSAVDSILLRARAPLLAGGSGLYYRAVVDDLRFPPTDASVRAQISRLDPDTALNRLRRRDPDAAARIEPANARRVVRALEVMELTGRRFSEFRSAWDRYESRYDLVDAGIQLDPDELTRRIRRRVDEMFSAGLLAEAGALLERGLRSALTASKAIAYPEAVACLDGAITVGEAREQIIRNTRRFARRQLAWFRADPRIVWFDGTETAHAAREIRAYYSREIARRNEGA